MSAITSPKSLRAASLLSVLLGAGCIRVGDLSHSAMQYNEAVEEAQNRMLLLNVVRAKSFRPMYITDLTKVTGNIKLDLNSGGIETDYGPYINTLTTGKKFLTSGKLTPSIDYVHNPTFDVNVLSTQDFEKGFLSPATKSLLAYYWEQGWPQEFLLYVFVHHVRWKDQHGMPRYYENYPDAQDKDLKKLEDFGEWVTKFVSSMPKFVAKPVKIGPCLERNEVSDLDDLVKATKEGLSITEVEEGRYQLQQPTPDLVLMSHAKAEEAEKAEKAATARCKSTIGNQTPAPPPAAAGVPGTPGGAGNQNPASPPPAAGEPGKLGGAAESESRVTAISDIGEATLYLRSPEEIIFYLGELMRVTEKLKKVPAVCIDGKLWPLFVAFEKPGRQARICKSSVDIVYEGTEYMIPDPPEPPAETAAFKCPSTEIRPTLFTENQWAPPEPTANQHKYLPLDSLKCAGGMSMESFSLLTQLIALQKSAKDVPTTSVIRAIAQ